MSNKDIERWLLARRPFKECTKCVNRKSDCHKNCEFYQRYKKGTNNEQR